MLFFFFAGIVVGVGSTLIAGLWGELWGEASEPAPRAALPPATARQLDRVRRRNRADLRPVLAAELARRFISPAAGEFDEEHTHP